MYKTNVKSPRKYLKEHLWLVFERWELRRCGWNPGMSDDFVRPQRRRTLTIQ